MGVTLRIELFPADPQRSVEFYRQVLRFSADGEVDGYTRLRRDQVTIGISAHSRRGDPAVRRPPDGTEIVLEVDDVDLEYAAVEASGWPIDSPITTQSWGLRDFRILDPGGYYLRVTHR